MQVTLIIRSEDGDDRSITLPNGVSTLGREADISFPNRGLSRQHAQIEVATDTVRLSDLGSKNGTYLGSHRIEAPTVLSDCDVLSLGQLTLTVRIAGPERPEPTETQPPMPVSRTYTGTWTGANVGEAPAPMRLVVVSSVDSSAVGWSCKLDGQVIVVGRHAGETRFEDRRMSGEHVRFAPTGHGYWVDDLGSSNGTFVDGIPLTEPRPVEPQQVIRAGNTVLVVDGAADVALWARQDADETQVSELLGVSMVARQIRCAIVTAAGASAPVLLLGPTGVGKEVAAAAIHRLSRRCGAFVPVNCAAISPSLAEATLFGNAKGAFTGAHRASIGCIVRSSEGTLFLDEVGDLHPEVQAKLLRALQDGIVNPVGNAPAIATDLRVVAATNKDVQAEGFRPDLLARLAGWVLQIPPLAARKVDIPVLFDHFFRGDSDVAPVRGPDFDEALLLYAWPRNIRELQREAGRLKHLLEGTESQLTLDLLSAELRARVSNRREQKAVAGVNSPSRERLIRALRATKGNVSLAAERNAWHRNQLMRWLKRLQIDPNHFREAKPNR